MSDIKSNPQPVTDTLWYKIQQQIKALDDALYTVPVHGSPESMHTRQYIVAQIEALKWVLKKLEV